MIFSLHLYWGLRRLKLGDSFVVGHKSDIYVTIYVINKLGIVKLLKIVIFYNERESVSDCSFSLILSRYIKVTSHITLRAITSLIYKRKFSIVIFSNSIFFFKTVRSTQNLQVKYGKFYAFNMVYF